MGQYVEVKYIISKEKAPCSNLIRNNQNERKYFRYDFIKFTTKTEAYLYFKEYFLNNYRYTGNIKVKISNYGYQF